MAAVTLLPYFNLGEVIETKLGCDSPGVVVVNDSVRYSDGGAKTPFSLDITCKLTDAEMELVRADGHHPRLVLQMISVSSRERRMVPPGEGDDPLEAKFSIEFDPARHFGTVELFPMLVNGRFQTADPSTFGRLLGWGPKIVVEIDEAQRPLGNGLPVRWHSFEADDSLPDEHLFHVRMEELPTILLNSDISGLEDVLSSNGTHGRKARIRDSVFALIVHQVWTSLISECLFELELSRREQPEMTLEEHSEPMVDWKRSVIRDWIPQLLELEGMDDTLPEELSASVISERLPAMIQRRFRTPRMGFVGLHMDSGLFSPGDDE